MIRKSILFCSLFFTLYSVFLSSFKINWNSAQYQYQENVIKADRYIYTDTVPQKVIIGTSLSATLIDDSINKYGVCNLSMAGMSIFDGLNVLVKQDKLPKTIFVEINYFYKTENREFGERYNSKVLNFAKLYIPAFRDENQPVGIIKHLLKSRNKFKPTDVSLEIPKNIFQELLSNYEKEYSNPDITLINNSSVRLKTYVNKLEARGCKICFFEMPVNPVLENSPLAKIVRLSISSNFPDNIHLPLPNKNYHTIEGIHLDKREATDYTSYLRKQMLTN